MSSKKRRNQKKRQIALNTQTSPNRFRFWKVVGMIAVVVTLIIGGLIVYKNHQYRAALLTPSETVNGSDTNHDETQLWSSLRGQLVDFQADPFIGKKAVALYEQIPRYREVTAKAFQQASGLQIDYIANAHQESDIPEGDPTITQSQKKTRELLENLHQDSTGIEGSYCDTLNIRCFIDELISRTHEVDPTVSTERIKDIVYNDLMRTDATLGFLHDNPNAPMTGLEAEALHRLHFATIEQIKGGNFRYYPLEVASSEARSDMALARMITFMRKNNKLHGVIVLGYGHEPRVKETMARIGIASKIYNVQ